MTRRSLSFLFLAIFGLMVSSVTSAANVNDASGTTRAAAAKSDNAHPKSDKVQTIYIVLNQSYGPLGFWSRPGLVEPVLKPYYHSSSGDRVIQGTEGEEIWINTTYLKKRTASGKTHANPLKLPINIIKQPDYGTLDIRGVKSLVDKSRRLMPDGWKPVTPTQSSEQPKGNKPGQNKIYDWEREILHTYTLYYTTSRAFTGADEFIVEFTMPGAAKPQLTKYIVTR